MNKSSGRGLIHIGGSSEVDLSYFSVEGGPEDGISIDRPPGASPVKIRGVASHSNGRDGFNLPSEGVDLSDSTAMFNGRDGVHVRVPAPVAEAIVQDVEAGASGEEIVQKYGVTLAKYGKAVTGIVGLAANASTLLQWALSL